MPKLITGNLVGRNTVKTDWATIMDGHAYICEKGVDFDSKIESFKVSVYTKARESKVKATVEAVYVDQNGQVVEDNTQPNLALPLVVSDKMCKVQFRPV